MQFRSTLQLTDATIKALQHYYLAAVNRHIGGNWKDLKMDILSTLFHCASTDEKPHHSLCSEEWCFYKKDVKANVPIRSHTNMKVAIRCSNPEDLAKVHEIY